MSPDYNTLPSLYQQYIAISRYSRYLDKEKRRETWTETVDRYINFWLGRLDKLTKNEDDKKYLTERLAEAREAILKLEVLPSMRALMTAGKALDRHSVSGYNCSFIAIDDYRAFDEILYILCCGTGAGFSVEQKYIDKLPEVPSEFHDTDTTIVVADSKIGWASSLRELISLLYAGKVPKWDVSKVRPSGARLKTMGGRASGPGPLVDLFKFVIATFKNAVGRRLLDIECHDIITKIGEIVVCGGVRRSAEISLSDLTSTNMRHAKSGTWYETSGHRALANNSAVYYSKPPVDVFMEEWIALYRSKSGERGIFNISAARKTSPARRDASKLAGGNPCFSAGTMIHTREGHFPIESLVGKTVDVWDGSRWVTVDNFRVTGENQRLLKITMHDGSKEFVTPYHTVILENGQRVEAQDLAPGNRLAISTAPLSHGSISEKGAYLKGFLVGDGSKMGDRALLYLYFPKWQCESRLIDSANELDVEKIRTNAVAEVTFAPSSDKRKIMTGLAKFKAALLPWSTDHKRSIPADVFNWDLKSKTEFIAGVMDADGTASDGSNGFLYQITSIHKEWLLGFQSILKTIGVHSRLAKAGNAGVRDFKDGYGEYNVKDTWRLTISQEGAINLAKQCTFTRLVSFARKELKYNLKPKHNIVVSIEEYGDADKVYCCTVDSTHSLALTSGFQYGQCGEIVLRSAQFCNLSSIIVKDYDTEETLTKKAKIASFLGTLQATLTDFKYLRKSWKDNCEDERLLGVSLGGTMSNPLTYTQGDNLNHLLERLTETVITENIKIAAIVGINPATAATCQKPDGNTSQLCYSASGGHPWWSPYYLRTVRINKTDPLYGFMSDHGVYVEDDIMKPSTTAVFYFPIKAPDGVVFRKDITAIQHLELWLTYKKHFTEHNPSVTIYVKEHEWLDVGAWVYNHFDEVCGLSFFPWSDHIYKQAPYQEITEEEYNKWVEKMPKSIDWTKLSEYETEDMTTGAREYACTGGQCEIL